LDRLVADRDAGKLSLNTTNVAQALGAWLAHLEPDRASATLREHRRTVEKAIVPVLESIKLSALTPHMIDSWLTGQKTSAPQQSLVVGDVWPLRTLAPFIRYQSTSMLGDRGDTSGCQGSL